MVGFTAEYIISDLLERMEKSEKESNDIRNACKSKCLTFVKVAT